MIPWVMANESGKAPTREDDLAVWGMGSGLGLGVYDVRSRCPKQGDGRQGLRIVRQREWEPRGASVHWKEGVCAKSRVAPASRAP